MLKTLKTTFRSERGFTLIELLAVMSIVAILTGIVTTAVSGTGESSRDAAARENANGVNTAAGDFFSDQGGAEVLTPSTVEVVIDINGVDNANLDAAKKPTVQGISSRWPETPITEKLDSEENSTTVFTTPYAHEFPTSNVATSSLINNVIITDSSGIAIDHDVLLTRYTAIDFVKLVGDPNDPDTPGGYSEKAPASVDQTQKALGQEFHNFLWLFRKATSAGGSGPDDSRSIALFKLVSIEQVNGNTQVDLTYEQIN